MYIPPNFKESEVVDTIYRVALRLADKFRFGYYEREDICQEALIIVIESKCLEKYDIERPLENFLYSHLHKRLYNFKRNKYKRPNPPCLRCPLAAFIPPDKCTAYKEKSECKFYKRWEESNTSKENIMNTIYIDHVRDAEESSMSYCSNLDSNFIKSSAHETLMESLSLRGRKYYIMFLNGCRIKAQDKKFLQKEIASILDINGKI